MDCPSSQSYAIAPRCVLIPEVRADMPLDILARRSLSIGAATAPSVGSSSRFARRKFASRGFNAQQGSAEAALEKLSKYSTDALFLGRGIMEKKPRPSTEHYAAHARLNQRQGGINNQDHAGHFAGNREKLATRLKPLMAGLDSADPSVEYCPICHQALLPEIGRCNVFHVEADYALVKSRFIQGPQLRRRGWSIPQSRGGYRIGALRFLGDALAYLPREFNPDLFDLAHCIPLYGRTEVEAIEQTLEFKAFIENAHKIDRKQIAQRVAATVVRKAQRVQSEKKPASE